MKLPKDNKHATLRFFDAILSLQNHEECISFFKDLCTPTEMESMIGRLEVATLLYEGGKSYRDIQNETGASLVTIGRVARFLMQEDNAGYRRVLDKMTKNLPLPTQKLDKD
jgi:TrpR-related protein YerC/YecD